MAATPRCEDARFLTGAARYTADCAGDWDAATAVFVRSPHAHARIRSLDTAAAARRPGVLAVLSAREVAADGLGDIRCPIRLGPGDRAGYVDPGRPLLAHDTVRYVGDAVALAIADSEAAAKDAAERVRVDYEPLDAVTDARAALDPAAPTVWPQAPDNRCLVYRAGDDAACAAAFADAAHAVELIVRNNRVAAMTLEPRAALARPRGDGVHLMTPSQGVGLLRHQIAAILNLSPNALRVETPDVGGGFGMKLFCYPEQALIAWAARRLGRAVFWQAERGEAFLSDTQARDHRTTIALALDRDGRFLALRAHTIANLGACLSNFSPATCSLGFARILSGVYAIPAVSLRVEGAFTHTGPVDAYRGAGRPEAIHALERLVDQAARETGIERIALRRRNFVRADRMPWRNALGARYDSGEFEAIMDRALEAARWSGFEARARASAKAGRLRGIGLACTLHATGAMPGARARLVAEPAGRVRADVGTQSSGQGHETVYAALLAETLQLDAAEIALCQGDSARLAWPGGTGGSSSAIVSGHALREAGLALIENARRRAAEHLEAAPEDIAYAAGAFSVAGTDRRVDLFDLAADGGEPLDADARFDGTSETFPNGCQVCEVEIDPQTGAVAIRSYCSIDDIGRVLDETTARGQVHGGIAQGLGQALLEAVRYDSAGQPLSGSLMDYAVPRSDDLPAIGSAFRGTATRRNPLGIKGIGECGSIGAPPALMNAIQHALARAGVRAVIDMPATPQAVWRALRTPAN